MSVVLAKSICHTTAKLNQSFPQISDKRLLPHSPYGSALFFHCLWVINIQVYCKDVEDSGCCLAGLFMAAK